MTGMHDWVLVAVLVEWNTGRAAVIFDADEAALVSIVGESVPDPHVCQANDRGPAQASTEHGDH